MEINKLILNNFRNHTSSEFSFSSGINVLHGNNGAGKTSVLEAISICSISRSFCSNSEHSLINNSFINTSKNHSEKFYIVGCYCNNDLSIPYKINVKYSLSAGKNISSTIGENLRPKDIIGEIPLVILSPDNKNITNSSPEFRRQFVNGILSQMSKYYLEKLYEHRKLLKQRNALLHLFKEQKIERNQFNSQMELLEQWTNLFVETSAEIVKRRKDFIDEFNPLFIEAYKKISKSREKVEIIYLPNSISGIEKFSAKEEIKIELNEKAKRIQAGELKRNTTLFGPQKDEFCITINGGIARELASQGQHKSILIALKFAEFEYLSSKKNETPIILFDDIFSELDAIRVNEVINLLAYSNAQIFITVTEPDLINLNKQIQKTFIKIENRNF